MTELPRSDHVGIAAVVFDLDGVLIDSESAWNAAREAVAQEHGGRWPPGAQSEMMGMSSTEWSRHMSDVLGVQLSPAEISDAVVAGLEDLYRRRLPLVPGALDTVVELSGTWPLALASSANRPIIELVLDLARLRDRFKVTVSSEEVARGKPAPDVYLEAARRLGVSAARCVAVEDSSNGLRSAAAAAMTVIAVPNPEYPAAEDALALADTALASIRELTTERVREAAARRGRSS